MQSIVQKLLNKETESQLLTKITFVFVVVVFFAMLFKYCVIDIPTNDDYGYSLGVVNNIVEKNDFAKTFRIIFNTAVEHRVVLFKSLALFSNKVFGAVNFGFINFVGGLSSIFIFFIYIKSVSSEYLEKKNWYLLLPVLFLILIPINKVNNWGITAIANTQVHLFTYLSLYFLHKNKWLHYVIALLCAALALFSMGNGLFLFIIGTVVLLVHKRFIQLGIWLAFTGFLSYFYFDGMGVTSGMNVPEYHPRLSDKIIYDWKSILTFPSVLMGALFRSVIDNLVLISIIGWGMLIGGLVFVLKHFKYFFKNTLLPSYLLFVLMSVAAAAQSRGYISFDGGLVERYGMYPMLYLCILYLMYLTVRPETIKKYFPYILIASVVLYFSRVAFNIKGFDERKQDLVTGIVAYNNGDYTKLSHPKRKEAAKRLEECARLGTYIPPAISSFIKNTSMPNSSQPFELSENANRFESEIKILVDGDKLLQLEGFAFPKKLPPNNPGFTSKIVLQNKSKAYVFEPAMMKTMLNKKMQRGYLRYSSFNMNMLKDQVTIPTGRYDLGILIYRNGQLEQGIDMKQKIEFL